MLDESTANTSAKCREKKVGEFLKQVFSNEQLRERFLANPEGYAKSYGVELNQEELDCVKILTRTSIKDLEERPGVMGFWPIQWQHQTQEQLA